MPDVPLLVRIVATVPLAALIVAGCTSTSNSSDSVSSGDGASATTPTDPDTEPVVEVEPAARVVDTSVEGVRVRLAELPKGEPARVEHLVGDEVVRSDGSRVRLHEHPEQDGVPGMGFMAIVPLQAGWLTFHDDGMHVHVMSHRPDGTVVREDLWSDAALLPSPDRQTAVAQGPALLGVRGESMRWGRWGLPRGFLGPRRVPYETRAGQVRIAEPDGTSAPVPGVTNAKAASPAARALTGHPSAQPGRRTTTVFDDRGVPQLVVPGYDLIGFSPDGSHVVGSRRESSDVLVPRRDGTGYRLVTRHRDILLLVSRSTSTVLKLVLRDGAWDPFGPPLRWEDDTHVLLTPVRDCSCRVRVSVGGRLERAPLPGSEAVQEVGTQ